MEIPLSAEYEIVVRERVGSGQFNSITEVVEEGLRLLLQRDDRRALQLENLRNELKVGLDAIDRGELLEEHEVFAQYGLREDE